MYLYFNTYNVCHNITSKVFVLFGAVLMIINKSNDNGSGPWGSGGDQNPWGKRPNSNGTPPDVDELLRQSKDKLKK